MTTSPLRSAIAAEIPGLTAIRHDLHRHPELSYQEQRTCGVVQRELAAMGIAFKAGMAKGTGVVAHLPATGGQKGGSRDRPAVALRADMDALPITERTGRPYSSGTPGVMHACGHDGHTTMLLGAARVLSKLPHRPNPVTFIFQPAEEGGAGGEKMCEEGALAGEGRGGLGPPVGRIFGLHGWPQLDVGVLASRHGPLLAATDDFDVVIRGTGAHAAYPQLSNDPIVAGAHIVTALQTLVSRNVAPQDSAVVTVGMFQGGTATNIIPETSRIVGTIRTLLPETRVLLKKRLYEVMEKGAATFGCRAEIGWQDGYPATVNDAAATERFFSAARGIVGADRVKVVEHPTMGGEDFSYYGRHVPACFFLLGLKPAGASHVPTLHQPDFDFNDGAMPIGIEAFCRLALEEA
jgi:amidohydrolase